MSNRKARRSALWSVLIVALVFVTMFALSTTSAIAEMANTSQPVHTASAVYAVAADGEAVTQLEQLAPVIPETIRIIVDAIFFILAIFLGVKYRAIGKVIVMLIVGIDYLLKARKPESPGGEKVTLEEAQQIWDKMRDGITAAQPLLPEKWFKNAEEKLE